MPTIFDNIETRLLPELQQALDQAYRADFCVGYFNLRGWKELGARIEGWPGGEGGCVRLLVGMQRPPQDELRLAYRFTPPEPGDDLVDNATRQRMKLRLAEEFKRQLTIGAPNAADEAALQRLAGQLRQSKLVVRLFLRHPLHAKLYLVHRHDRFTPTLAFLGSSNLTFAGLAGQGELNVDVRDNDAEAKLCAWFEQRWEDNTCIDISQELAQIIEESWARSEPLPPYHIYLKMAYHLSQDARAGLSEFRIPNEFSQQLFDFQKAAVQIAAHHLNQRGGVLIGDVVGLGKTLMATALARIFEDDYDLETLILCPKNLVSMWESYRERYRLRGRVLSYSLVRRDLPQLKRYRLIILDESHNLRNRQGRRYLAIREYIQQNDSRCILLSATPYNKSYLDLSSQLRLFTPEDRELPVRPERLLREMGEETFRSRYECSPHSLAAFEKSPYADDWRELMRLFMVRRTRSFIINNYTQLDPQNQRPYLPLSDGGRAYFPVRRPRRAGFSLDEANPNDPYARLYADEVVEAINSLHLPRYGLGNYIAASERSRATHAERTQLDNLGRAGQRLMGFCRTNLFKRLESSGAVFIASVERHILRNYIFLHAIENDLPLPIGAQESGLLDLAGDQDYEIVPPETAETEQAATVEPGDPLEQIDPAVPAGAWPQRAAAVYAAYRNSFAGRFTWLRAGLFSARLAKHLRQDARTLEAVLARCGPWQPAQDAKLQALIRLLTEQHPAEKVLVFTQFADTVAYLESELRAAGVERLAGAVGSSGDPTRLAQRFSPVSNGVRRQVTPEDELRVLLATDVLSEGQNLQDAAIVVNYDLPWAIIRLIQRAGRVDRIGQQQAEVLCYSFLPAEGVERILRLRERVRTRLQENAEVVGTDEAFFEDELGPAAIQAVSDLYNERAGVLDGSDDQEVDLASYAYQIWKNAITDNPALQRIIPDLPNVAYSAKRHVAFPGGPAGVLVYARTPHGSDALAWVDADGQAVTQSQFEILRAAACGPDEPARPRWEEHHELVRTAMEQVAQAELSAAGQLGPRSGARARVYERLKRFYENNHNRLWASEALRQAVDEIHSYPLRETARDALQRQLRAGIEDQHLAEMVIDLRTAGRLCQTEAEPQQQEAHIICSLGLVE